MVLYMSAVASLRCNPQLKGFYDRLIANNKPPKVALVAVMRKLLKFMNAVLNIIPFGLMIMFNTFLLTPITVARVTTKYRFLCNQFLGNNSQTHFFL